MRGGLTSETCQSQSCCCGTVRVHCTCHAINGAAQDASSETRLGKSQDTFRAHVNSCTLLDPDHLPEDRHTSCLIVFMFLQVRPGPARPNAMRTTCEGKHERAWLVAAEYRDTCAVGCLCIRATSCPRNCSQPLLPRRCISSATIVDFGTMVTKLQMHGAHFAPSGLPHLGPPLAVT